MKKIAAIFIMVLSMLFLFGCGDETPTPDDSTNPPAVTPEDPEPEEPTPTYYTVTWVDEKGQTLSTASVKENETPSYAYSVTDTAEWDYTFLGWALTQNGDTLTAIPAATQNATYYAKVSQVKQKYTVTFNTNGGSEVQSQTVEYGSKASLPVAPTYENHKFIGWCYDNEGNNPVDFEAEITGNVQVYAIWNEVLDLKSLLSSLLEGYDMSPFDYIPESMRADFSDNLVSSSDVITDYSQGVSVADISYGFGEQWHMILDNLQQTKTFYSVLSVVESLSATSIAAFNNYFDANPSEKAHHEFESGIYNIAIKYDGEVLYYVVDYTAQLPVLGEQTVQIALSLNVESGERVSRIQLGDANAITYRVLENSYEFAIKYLGIRRAMLSLVRNDDGSVDGKIYEFLTVSSLEIGSAADFYISEDYVSVVGNKSSSMLGFTGYISELYDTKSGKMIGYEVEETLSSITYNTLWFNLSEVMGINFVKYREKNESIAEAFFVNGMTSEWEAKKVGGLSSKMLSRRFDIEFRTQYVYSYNAASGEYTEHEIKVPMLFVQEENYETLISDVLATNDVNISILVTDVDFEKLLLCYDELIPVFVQNKELITSEMIVAYIGERISLSANEE